MLEILSKKMLSMLSLLTIVNQHESNCVSFMMDLSGLMIIPSVYKDWGGIDSSLCVILLHHTHQHMTKKKTLVPKSTTKQKAIKIYIDVWNIYEAVCKENGLSFVPCMNGLSTIILKRKFIEAEKAKKKKIFNIQREDYEGGI